MKITLVHDELRFILGRPYDPFNTCADTERVVGYLLMAGGPGWLSDAKVSHHKEGITFTSKILQPPTRPTSPEGG